MKDFSILKRSVAICELLQSIVPLWLLLPRHESDFVHLEHGLEQIWSTIVHDSFELVVAWVLPEPIVVQVRLIDLNWGSLIAHHELLETKEAQVPTISLFVCHELGDRRRSLKLWTHFELPHASIHVGVPEEWSPVFEMLWLVRWHWHLSDVSDHILIVNRIVQELRFVVNIE